VCAQASGAGLQDAVRTWEPDLVVLDIGLPGADGIALVPLVRAVTAVPVMMLTARADTRDKVAALEAGADHYITKPVELDELLARIAAALRRPALAERATLTFADVEMDLTTRLVRRGSRYLDLTPREFALFELLMRTPGRAFGKDELLENVWESTTRATAASSIATFRTCEQSSRRPVKNASCKRYAESVMPWRRNVA
jgi:DNA-binding response OmpR family regulator